MTCAQNASNGGTSDNCTIAGFGADDTIEALGGNDGVAAPDGNDTYVYSRGDGDDSFDETTAVSWYSGWKYCVVLHDVDLADVHVERTGDDVLLVIAESSAGAGDGGRVTLLGTGSDNGQKALSRWF